MLEIHSLNQYYGGSHILRHIHGSFEAGKLTVLLGRNGVGKTTLLRCLMGLLPIRSGSISWRGKALEKLATYQRVANGLAYVPQGRDIFPRLTVEENLLTGAASRGGKRMIPESSFCLFTVLKEMGRRRGGDLSGGQQQQLAIARALMSEPQCLLLDEPTEGIQPSVIKEIGRTLRALVSDHGLTILLVEQYYDFAHQIADSYAVMERGEIVATGLASNMEQDGVREMISV
jgi:urea transport system ATP-binding protein